MKSTITEMKNSVEGSNSRWELAKEKINKLEDKTTEIIQSKGLKEYRMKENEQIVRDAWISLHTLTYTL